MARVRQPCRPRPLKEFEHPRSHTVEHLSQTFTVANAGRLQIVRMLPRMQEQADAGRMHGITDNIAKPADAHRHASPGRQVQSLFSRIRHAFQ
jgi:hypothetical protein